MKIVIHDVEHGQCAVITAPNGKKLMIDTGHNSSTSWRPSTTYAGQEIEQLIISNFDQDHTSDFVNVRDRCKLKSITANETISSANLQAMKAQYGMSAGITALHGWLKGNESGQIAGNYTSSFGDMNVRWFFNAYGFHFGRFSDANNLSVATFVQYHGFKMLFPGDLETEGWEQLLKSHDFQDELYGVTILLASHHGRENGCSEPSFWYMTNAKAVIISDKGKEHSTQETCQWYADRVSGVHVAGNSGLRKVLTTRKDGTITIDVKHVLGSTTFDVATGGGPSKPSFIWI